jgi:hypothetical protein
MIKKVNLKKILLINIVAAILALIINISYFQSKKNIDFYSVDLETIQNTYLNHIESFFENYFYNSFYEFSLIFDKYKFYDIDFFKENFNAGVNKNLVNSTSIQIKGDSIVFFEINNYKNFKQEFNRYLINQLKEFHEKKIKKIINEKITIDEIYFRYLDNNILGSYNEKNFQTNHELFYEQILFNQRKLDLNNLLKKINQLEINYNDLNYENFIIKTKNLSLIYRLIYFIFSYFLISIVITLPFFNSIFRSYDN